MTSEQVGRLCVLAAAVLWGTSGTAQALGPAQASAVGVGFGRILIGSILLTAIAVRWDASSLRRVMHVGRYPALCAAAAAAVFRAAFFSAVALTGVAVGTVVALGSAPVFTGLLARVSVGERPEPRWGVATALAVAGCTLILAPWRAGAAAVSSTGVALALLSGFTYGLYTVSAKRLLLQDAPLLGILAVTLGGATLLLTPFMAVMSVAGYVTVHPLFSSAGLTMLLWLGVVTTAVAYILYTAGLRRVPAATVGSLALGEPLTASALGFLVLGERPSLPALAGAVLLFAGLLLLALPRPNPAIPGAPHRVPTHPSRDHADI
jgi:drug/metabolite transporter, DME family